MNWAGGGGWWVRTKGWSHTNATIGVKPSRAS